jgi:hypothetical protein
MQYKALSTVPGPEGGIDQDAFERCLGPIGLHKNLVTERVFKASRIDFNFAPHFPLPAHEPHTLTAE